MHLHRPESDPGCKAQTLLTLSSRASVSGVMAGRWSIRAPASHEAWQLWRVDFAPAQHRLRPGRRALHGAAWGLPSPRRAPLCACNWPATGSGAPSGCPRSALCGRGQRAERAKQRRLLGWAARPGSAEWRLPALWSSGGFLSPLLPQPAETGFCHITRCSCPQYRNAADLQAPLEVTSSVCSLTRLPCTPTHMELPAMAAAHLASPMDCLT